MPRIRKSLSKVTTTLLSYFIIKSSHKNRHYEDKNWRALWRNSGVIIRLVCSSAVHLYCWCLNVATGYKLSKRGTRPYVTHIILAFVFKQDVCFCIRVISERIRKYSQRGCGNIKNITTISIYDSNYAWRDNVLTLKTCTGTYRIKW
jgi:hypothetical protein